MSPVQGPAANRPELGERGLIATVQSESEGRIRMLHIIAFNLAFVTCLAYASWRGGAPERLAMVAQALANVFTILAIHFLPRASGFHSLAHALAAIDVVLLVALTALALRANRLWPIVLAGLQLTTVFVHLSKAVFPDFPAASYGIFAQFWAWPMLLATAWGTRNHRSRERMNGEERDWKPLWPHSVPASSPF